jgi:integrase
LFDALDGKIEKSRSRGRKGTLTAMRDAALLKTIYAYGLRRNEARMLDLADLRRAQKSPQYGRFGGLYVRYGKASSGSPPKRRTVLTVPEMDWIVDVLDDWVTSIRPLFSPGKLAALFVTDSPGRGFAPGGEHAVSLRPGPQSPWHAMALPRVQPRPASGRRRTEPPSARARNRSALRP